MAGRAQENASAFRWTEAKARAAVMLAEDDITDEQIAATIGVNPATLWRWKQHTDFTDRIAENVARLHAAMMRYPVAKRRRRLAVLDDLHTKALGVIADRAIEHEEGPGGKTGLVVMQLKQVKHLKVEEDGETRSWTEEQREYVVDTALMREIRAIHEQAAKELGQWTEKTEEVGGVRREYVIVRDGPPPAVAAESGS